VAQLPFLDRITKTLRAHFDATASEPLPRRWIDLITYLNEMDAAQAKPLEPGTEQGTEQPRRRPGSRTH